MVRHGWQQLDVPTGWVQILRGPRPKAEKWPAASAKVEGSPNRRVQNRQSGSPQLSRGQPVCTPPPLRQVSKPPEKVAADAVGEIERLQAAIGSSGRFNKGLSNLCRKPFASLRHALHCLQSRSVWIRASCSWNVPRSACSVLRRSSTELANKKFCTRQKSSEGEERLAKLVAKAANIQSHPVVAPQVSELQARIDALVVERDALRSAHAILVPAAAQGTWMGCGLHRFEDIPPFPTSDAQDLAVWMSQRNLRVAQCNRVWGSHARGKDWWSLGARCFSALHGGKRPPRGDLPKTDISDDEMR